MNENGRLERSSGRGGSCRYGRCSVYFGYGGKICRDSGTGLFGVSVLEPVQEIKTLGRFEVPTLKQDTANILRVGKQHYNEIMMW